VKLVFVWFMCESEIMGGVVEEVRYDHKEFEIYERKEGK